MNKEFEYKAILNFTPRKDQFMFTVTATRPGRERTERVVQQVSWDGTHEHPAKAEDVAKYIKKEIQQYSITDIHVEELSVSCLSATFESHGLTLVGDLA